MKNEVVLSADTSVAAVSAGAGAVRRRPKTVLSTGWVSSTKSSEEALPAVVAEEVEVKTARPLRLVRESPRKVQQAPQTRTRQVRKEKQASTTAPLLLRAQAVQAAAVSEAVTPLMKLGTGAIGALLSMKRAMTEDVVEVHEGPLVKRETTLDGTSWGTMGADEPASVAQVAQPTPRMRGLRRAEF